MAFRSASSNTTPAISVTVPVPAGVVAGDVIILYSTTDVTDNAAALPAGFTLLPAGVLVTNSDNSGFKAWVKIAGASESAFVVDNSAGGVALIAGALAFSGRNGAQFIASLAAATTGVVNLNLGGGASNSSIVSPANVDAKGLTAPLGADLLWLGNADISVFGALTSFTPPSGYTIAHGLSSGFLAMGAAYKENTSAGATGDVSGTVTFSSGASGASAFLLAIPAQTVSGYPNLKSSATPFLTNGTTQVAAVVQPLPATYSLGDLLLWVIHSDTTAACTYPSGWTALASVSSSVDQGTLSVGWRYATGSEPANYTATPATSDWIASSMYAVTGVASTSAINVFANSADTSTNTTIIPAVSVTTTSANTLVLWVGAADNLADLVSNSAGYIEPAGYARADYVSNPNWCSFDLAYAYKAAAGIEAVGTGSVAAGASGGQMAIVLAIAPAPTGPLFDSALFDSVLFDTGAGATAALVSAPATTVTVTAGLTTAIRVAASLAASAVLTASFAASAAALAASIASVSAVTVGLTTAIVLASAPTAQASVTAGLTSGITLAATPAASSALTANLSAGIRLASTPAAASAVTGALTTGIPLAAAPAAAATLTGTMATNAALLAATPAAVASVAGTLTTGIPLQAAPVAQSALVAAVSTGIPLASAPATTAAVTGSLTTAIRMASAPAGTASVTGALSTQIPLAAAPASVSAVTGGLSTQINLASAPAAQAALAGTLSTQIRLAATPAAVASLAADLATAPSGLAATTVSASTLTGALTTAIPLQSAPASVAAVTGGLTTAIRLQAAPAGTAALVGGLSTGISLAAGPASAATLSAGLSTGIPLAAAPGALSTASGALTTSIRLAATPGSQATITAGLGGTAAQFAATPAAQSALSAALTTGIPLQASAAGLSAATANLATGIRLQAATATVVALTANLGTVAQYVTDPRYIVSRNHARPFAVTRTARQFTVSRQAGRRFTVTRAARTFTVARRAARNFTRSAMSNRRFDEKDPTEKVTLTFNFATDLPTGVTLTGTPTVTVATAYGTDAAPSAIKNGNASLDATATMVIVPVMGGLNCCDYKVSVNVATTNALLVLELDGVLPVRS